MASSLAVASPAVTETGAAANNPRLAHQGDGVQFRCAPAQLETLLPAMDAYLKALDVEPAWVARHVDEAAGTVRYVLTTPAADTDTLTLSQRPLYRVTPEVVSLPAAHGTTRAIETVSRKEILLALLQHGRKTVFSGKACATQALEDYVGVRQMTVAWAERLQWGWPEGGPARWNDKLWERGTPRQGVAVHDALMDAFVNQEAYEIGCYTATKLVFSQGIVDYYRRVKGDRQTADLVEARLLTDGDPLVGIEPGRMWFFEKDFEPAESDRAGKVLQLRDGVAARNFVPGDWAYFLNTDSVTYEKTGYEGSNAIYLGRDRFDDYYFDHEGSYSFRQKMHEVWQWRNGVFSRSRDADKVVPLTEGDFERLAKTPEQGGLLLSFRAGPYLFGYETLPHLLSQRHP